LSDTSSRLNKILIFGTGRLGNALASGLIDHGYFQESVSTTGLIGKKQNFAFPEISNFGVIIWAARDSGTPANSENSSALLYNLLTRIRSESWAGYFIYISSAGEVYGNTGVEIANENREPSPHTPYGIKKFQHELLIQELGSNNKLKTLILRVSNIYSCSLSDGGVIGSILRNLKHGERLAIYGGQQQRDFIDIRDCVKATIKLIESKSEGIFNVASGESISILKLIKQFEDVFSKKTTFVLDTKFDGVTTANFSTDRLFEKTGFQPPGITKRFNSSYKLEELETVDDQ